MRNNDLPPNIAFDEIVLEFRVRDGAKTRLFIGEIKGRNIEFFDISEFDKPEEIKATA